ncbi:MAG: hypothetical protein ACW99Q_16895 [Candidatus Kariarchaeaceae archaeon]|jgi:ABC-type phosphate transport system permease subunit
MIRLNNQFTSISGIILALILLIGVTLYKAWTNKFSVQNGLQFTDDVRKGFNHSSYGVLLIILGNFITLYFSFGSLLGLVGAIRLGFGFNIIGTGLEQFQHDST